jgi:glycosyltransferase involved in cell wall biosynthesis
VKRTLDGAPSAISCGRSARAWAEGARERTSRDCRVALLVNFIPPYRVSLFRALQEEVGELRILVSTPVEPNRSWPADFAGLPVIVQRSVSLEKRWKRPGGFREISTVHLPYDTLNQLRRFQPDVIVSGELGVRSWMAAAYKRFCPRVRLLLWATVSERTERCRGFARERLRPVLLRQADAVLVNGASGARYIAAQGVADERVTRIPYTADVDMFSVTPIDRPEPDSISLLYVGVLVPRKGVLGFLSALAAWAHLHPQRRIEFHIAGDGPERSAIEAVRCPVNLRVTLLGNVAYNDLPQVYGRSSMLVMPTLEDEWGVVINEAMAAGLPILGSEHSQAIEELVVDRETGWTFKPEDRHSVFAALDAAFDTSAGDLRRMARAARAHAVSLTPKKVAQQIAAAIDRVVASRAADGLHPPHDG